jgi:4-hydroxythreonine-4-phosphate dehydrogenase
MHRNKTRVSDTRPVIGITMGDPVGIGPELICLALNRPEIYDVARPLVVGDVRIMEASRKITGTSHMIASINSPGAGRFKPGCIDVLNISSLDLNAVFWGHPTLASARAMIDYINTAVDLALADDIAAVVTCPINKTAMKMAGSRFPGHTELLAERTRTSRYAMMMAGSRLRVVLVTIHTALRDVVDSLSIDNIRITISLTYDALKERFGIDTPRIAVAGLNPHAGENGMFGDEESRLILPAIRYFQEKGMKVSGPHPPDTLFYHALDGIWDAIVCMYHDQGLIPFKMIHFDDGVNTTLGLPIIRTSVDHGTAYDIAGKGIADPGSLTAAMLLAAQQARCRLDDQIGTA